MPPSRLGDEARSLESTSVCEIVPLLELRSMPRPLGVEVTKLFTDARIAIAKRPLGE